MMSGKKYVGFSRNLLLTVVMLIPISIVFIMYVHAEKGIDRTNNIKNFSFQLADELRHSSDDLTRMARTYVVTGDQRYRKQYQTVLDIRDGRTPRPEGYSSRVYWDLVMADGARPRPNSPHTVPLIELMRQSGFTEQELAKLSEAKMISDRLAEIEIEAMNLAGATGPDMAEKRGRAQAMLYDQQYHTVKAAIMKPLDDFYVLMEKRTKDAVQAAERHALALRYLFVFFALWLLYMLWRTYAALGNTLGGSVDDVYAHIARIGSGEFSTTIPLESQQGSNVMQWLAETQAKLESIDCKRNIAEAALKESNAYLENLFNYANAPIIVWDANFCITRFNRAFEELTGRLAADVVGCSISLLFPGDQVEYSMNLISKTLTGERWETVEIPILHTNGSISTVLWNSATIFSSDGTIPVATIAQGQDITQRKLAEDALQRHLITLIQPLDDPVDIQFFDLFDATEIQAIQDAFAEATGVASIITNTEGIPLTTPSNFCRLCNDIIRPSKIGGANCFRSDAALCSFDASGPIIEACLSGGLWDAGASISVGGRHIANWLIGQVRNEAQDDEKMLDYADEIGVDRELFRAALAEVPSMPKEQFEKVALALYLFANQLSEKAYQNIQQGRFIAERKRIEDELKDKNTELERFTYTVSHDLKSPLITIQTYAGMIQKDMESGNHARARSDIKRIEDSAAKMTDLLNDLLELSRIGRTMNQPSQINMNCLVKDTLAQLAGLLAQNQVEVIQLSDLPVIRGDRNRIAEIMQNLIENAIKYRGNKSLLRIEIGVRNEETGPVFFVRDNGAGIEPRFHETIFGLFNKLDPRSEGTGVGLALVKRIVEVHGGRVWVESEGAGTGSCFCFTVPA